MMQGNEHTTASPTPRAGRSGGWGPGGIMLHSPELSRHARPLNRYLRHEAGLGGRVRALATLTTSREPDSQFAWAAHEPEARGESVSREIVEIIKQGCERPGRGRCGRHRAGPPDLRREEGA